MTARRLVVLGAVAVAVIAAGAVAWLWPAGTPAAEPSMMVSMTTTPEGAVTLEFEVHGLRAGQEYVVRLYAVDGGQVSASAGTLGRLVTEADGVGRLETSTATIGAGAEVPLTSELFAAPGARVEVVSAAGEVAASMTVMEGGARP